LQLNPGVSQAKPMNDEPPPYLSPAKKELEETLARTRHVLTPEIRQMVEDAIASLDHTDPKVVRELLLPDALAFFQFTSMRARVLAPLIKQSHDRGCFIESIVLDHGLVQFALRGLYVMAWQRAVMPTPLTPQQLAPFYLHQSKRGDVHWLVGTLHKNQLLQGDHHAKHLMMVNEVRNKAAHGVIFGEITTDELEAQSTKCQGAALGAIEWFLGWFKNPRPLEFLP
jgi:hypothetical protein